ncbi:G-protein coupled receptor GRL101-like [Pomacea canaliculata]|uniref:G-protein coupled receptor GRL101-like n=1 Tax=Pomacea canaliculata TaxID=400727 RepID=UPI000D732F30|nr:G-protein coupled receptor GRL101-like [Pomacea canaliculata]
MDLSPTGEIMMIALNHSLPFVCPESHFQCPEIVFYCLPVYLRCNGVYDCPGKEDELACDTYTCPGYYRCRASHVCVHADHMCDGWPQCPQADDELVCNLTCPDTCVCHGLAFTCTDWFPVSQHLDLRFLDARSSGLTLRDVSNNTMLVHLSLANCNITSLQAVNLINLRSLDLSDNLIQVINSQFLWNFHKLQSLSLSGNPLVSLYPVGEDVPFIFTYITSVDFSRIKIQELDNVFPQRFPNLTTLNISYCDIQSVVEDAFYLPKLHMLDLRGSPVSYYPQQAFRNLPKLEYLYADNYKICCPETLPFLQHVQVCEAPADEISSCESLVGSDVYRVFLAIFATLALAGNSGSFVYRVFVSKNTRSLGFDVFVTNLCVADFLMGVYLAMIGVVDRLFLGSYLWIEALWRKSSLCKLTGFLSLLSCEVSPLLICMITLDRLLVIKFPLSNFRFSRKSASLASGVVWTAGLFISIIPLLPMMSHWEFYTQNGFCVPLPITRKVFGGKSYAFNLTIIFNSVLFVVIAIGQMLIFCSVRVNRLSTSNCTKKSNDMTIARRLITIAVADFICWFPISLLGFMASSGIPIAVEAYVPIVVWVLPLNSVLNPFLYTFNIMLEKRQKSRQTELKRYLISQMNICDNK